MAEQQIRPMKHYDSISSFNLHSISLRFSFSRSTEMQRAYKSKRGLIRDDYRAHARAREGGRTFKKLYIITKELLGSHVCDECRTIAKAHAFLASSHSRNRNNRLIEK